MLHNFFLPPAVYSHLSKVVWLQITCLRYAAEVKTSEEICRQSFAEYLSAKDFPNREQVANWYFEKKTKRVQYLQRFAEIKPEQQEQKKRWVARITKEMADLLDKQIDKIAIGSFLEGEDPPNTHIINKIPTWKGVAYSFLLYFYDSFLKEEAAHFPMDLFEDNKSFGRRDFFRAMKEHNKEITICPICDENQYYTQVGERFYGFIDHYLPKAQYPHFSCHPCNLIPTCYGCNSTFKGATDPLAIKGSEQKKLYILRSALPYSAPCGDTVYLEVTLGDMKNHELQIGPLKPRHDQTELKKQEAETVITMLKDLYGIPERWDTHKIGEMVFRRMRQFLDNGHIIPNSNNTPSEIYNSLELLLYYLNHEDRQKDPFAFALTWTLVACIREQILPYLPTIASLEIPAHMSRSALLEEIEDWFFNQTTAEALDERSKKARALLSIPQTFTVSQQEMEALPITSD
jgi:hypothetical protein